MRCLDNITYSVGVNLSKLREILEDRWAWHAAVDEVAKSLTRLSDWKQQQDSITNQKTF